MNKARNSRRYQRTSEPMQVSSSQNSRENGLDQGWGEMMTELQKISNNTGKETKQRPQRWKKDKKNFYKAKFPSHVRNNTRREKKKHPQVACVPDVARNKDTTELQREKDKNQLLQKELEQVNGVHKELTERYQTDVANIRQQTNTFQCDLENEVKQKKLLQTDYTKLDTAYTLSQQKFSAELQTEKDKCRTLQEQLQRTSATLNEVSARYQTDIVNVSQQKDHYFQLSLENEIKQKKLLQTDYDKLDAAHTLSQQKFSAELQAEKDKCKALQEQLERTSVSPQEVNMRYQTDINNVRQQAYYLQLNLNNEIQQKMTLQTDYDKLQAAYTLSQQKFSAECDTEKIKFLQHELETIRVSHCQIRQMYDTDVVTVRQRAETLQRELDRETKAHADTVSEGWRVINTLRAEQDALRQKMAEEVNNIQQNTFKRERTFERELEELKAQLKDQISLNLKLSTELETEKEHYGAPRKRCRREEKEEECEPMKQQATINPAPSLGRIKDVEMSEKNPPETTRTPSLWKSGHHFLGLK